MKKLVVTPLLLAWVLLPQLAFAQSKPDILVLGDSQVSFGAGKQYKAFFEDLQTHCGIGADRQALLKKLGNRRTAAIGVRSTSLHSWTARDGRRKDTICEVDKKYGVNAGVYGIAGNPNRVYVQIGKGRDYQFCRRNRSAFEATLTPDYYNPKLLVLAFIGNSADRWARSKKAAIEDVTKTLDQIPRDMACVFMSTAPVYAKKTNDLRMKAQDSIKAAFARTGGRCGFVEGLTKQTRAAIEGQAKYFSRRKDGRIKDPLHPNTTAISRFLELNKPIICDAVINALKH